MILRLLRRLRIKSINFKAGFTVIEILMAIILIGIMAVVTLDVISDTLSESRFEETLAKMNQIKNAMIGDLTLSESGARTSFGFLGDIGAIPTAGQGIAGLLAIGALPAYAINATARIGLGWNGPYLTNGSTGTSYTTDAWGTALVYSPAANPPTLVSYGANAVAGGTGYNQDITVTLSNELRTATVNGFICDTGAAISTAAEVELNYPNGAGVLTQSLSTLIAGDAGKFTFASVPLGVRSISVYIPSKAAPTTTLGPVIITIDKPNFLVPCNVIDIDP